MGHEKVADKEDRTSAKEGDDEPEVEEVDEEEEEEGEDEACIAIEVSAALMMSAPSFAV